MRFQVLSATRIRFSILFCVTLLSLDYPAQAQKSGNYMFSWSSFSKQEESKVSDESIKGKKDTVPILKSEKTAFNLSFWGTVAPLPTIILAAPGLIVGPSLGY